MCILYADPRLLWSWVSRPTCRGSAPHVLLRCARGNPRRGFFFNRFLTEKHALELCWYNFSSFPLLKFLFSSLNRIVHVLRLQRTVNKTLTFSLSLSFYLMTKSLYEQREPAYFLLVFNQHITTIPDSTELIYSASSLYSWLTDPHWLTSIESKLWTTSEPNSQNMFCSNDVSLFDYTSEMVFKWKISIKFLSTMISKRS